MRVAVLSDIHGNSIALDAVMRDVEARGGADGYWVLGDLAALGFDPAGVLERVVRLPGALLVRGNTDRYLVTGARPGPTTEQCRANPVLWPARVEVASSFGWTQGMVTASGWVEWLAALPLEQRTTLPDGTRVLCVHAAPGLDEAPGVHRGTAAEELSAMGRASKADLLFVGHTHVPTDVTVDGVRLVNVGCVSNAFPPDLRAGYTLLEADEFGWRLDHRRVAYDREAAIEGLKKINHPAADFIVRQLRGENPRPEWYNIPHGAHPDSPSM
ncbi:MAG TPA: metallophosphoesterase family protein [Anaerolineae bacterium]|nr:metallophosphoesterase family protein [Anaerolineae bacterium]